MAPANTTADSRESGLSNWLTGIIAGLLSALLTGLVIQFGFDPAILSEGIPAGFGTSGLAIGWSIFLAIGIIAGLVYTLLAHLNQLKQIAAQPDSGVYLGAAYGIVLWLVAVIIVPAWVGAGQIGTYAVNLRGVASFVLFGILIGLVYAVSPYT